MGKKQKKKADPAGRAWVFTIGAEGPGSFTQERILEALHDCSYVVGQLERGEDKTEKNPDGYLHFQVYAEWPNSRRASVLRKRFGAGPGVPFHMERRKGTAAQAAAYCSKEDTREGGVFEVGEISPPSRQGKRTDLERLHSLIVDEGLSADEVALREPSGLRVIRNLQALEQARNVAGGGDTWVDTACGFMSGPTGCGKTRAIVETYGADAYRVTNYGSGAFDGYRGQKCIVLEDYAGQINPPTFLLSLADGYRPLWLPCRYQDRLARHRVLWIVSNRSWHELFGGLVPEERAAVERRFKLRREVSTPEQARGAVRDLEEGPTVAVQTVLDVLGGSVG